ncbi:MAG: 50S ribosomal protein L4 [Bdellovibrionales bacterium]|nr:50S ribosomal protein L4 [Bdellovibrionales bacterium]
MKVKIRQKDGKLQGEAQVSDQVFAFSPNEAVLYESVVAQLASKRQGTAKTKERGEVSGGGRKPYKQKGSGNARQGSTRAPNHVGGGTVFGPSPRNHGYKLNKKSRAKALISALSQHGKNESLEVFPSFEVDVPKTKLGKTFIGELNQKPVLVIDQANDGLYRSVRNLKNVVYSDVKSVSVLQLLKAQHVLISEAAVKAVEERFGS